MALDLKKPILLVLLQILLSSCEEHSETGPDTTNLTHTNASSSVSDSVSNDTSTTHDPKSCSGAICLRVSPPKDAKLCSFDYDRGLEDIPDGSLPFDRWIELDFGTRQPQPIGDAGGGMAVGLGVMVNTARRNLVLNPASATGTVEVGFNEDFGRDLLIYDVKYALNDVTATIRAVSIYPDPLIASSWVLGEFIREENPGPSDLMLIMEGDGVLSMYPTVSNSRVWAPRFGECYLTRQPTDRFHFETKDGDIFDFDVRSEHFTNQFRVHQGRTVSASGTLKGKPFSVSSIRDTLYMTMYETDYRFAPSMAARWPEQGGVCGVYLQSPGDVLAEWKQTYRAFEITCDFRMGKELQLSVIDIPRGRYVLEDGMDAYAHRLGR